MHVDPVLVQQALVQIFDNAAKYSPSRLANLGVGARARRTPDSSASATMAPASPQAEHARMWDRFVRGERHAATTSGSGLGLWIANAFIAANGGNMNAVSAGPGLGTTVTIELR